MPTPEHVPEKPVPCRHAVAMAECDFPYGHDGPHHAEVELPPHLNQFIGHMHERWDRERHSYRLWRYFFIVATLMNVTLYIVRLAQGGAS